MPSFGSDLTWGDYYFHGYFNFIASTGSGLSTVSIWALLFGNLISGKPNPGLGVGVRVVFGLRYALQVGFFFFFFSSSSN
jgi:hypothetical protein